MNNLLSGFFCILGDTVSVLSLVFPGSGSARPAAGRVRSSNRGGALVAHSRAVVDSSQTNGETNHA